MWQLMKNVPHGLSRQLILLQRFVVVPSNNNGLYRWLLSLLSCRELFHTRRGGKKKNKKCNSGLLTRIVTNY